MSMIFSPSRLSPYPHSQQRVGSGAKAVQLKALLEQLVLLEKIAKVEGNPAALAKLLDLPHTKGDVSTLPALTQAVEEITQRFSTAADRYLTETSGQTFRQRGDEVVALTAHYYGMQLRNLQAAKGV